MIRTLSQVKRSLGVGASDYDRTTRIANAVSAAARQVRCSPAYQRFVKWFRLKHPLCCDPFGDHARLGEYVAAEDVHHVRSVGEHPEKAIDPGNCRAICRACHARVSALERSGKSIEARLLFQGGD